GGGDRRAGQPGRRGRRRPHPRRGAQLRRRVPGLQPGADLRARRADRDPHDPALGPVLRRHQQAGVTMTLARHAGAAIVAAVVIWALSVSLNSFRDYQIAHLAVYVVALAGLTLLVGRGGPLSVGNGAVMAIGAYATALLQLHLGWPLWALFPASAAIAAVAGVAVGVAAARLHGPYLAGATLLLAVALPSFATQFPGVFGGDQGLSVTVTAPASLGATFPPTR